MVLYKKFVQIGRVCYIVHGVHKGKLAVIVDVIDQNRVLVDGPCTGVKRSSENIKNIHLTKFVVPKIFHSARTRTVKKEWEASKMGEQWADSVWAKKIAARERRANLTDFERFKLRKAKKMRNTIIRHAAGVLLKKERKNPTIEFPRKLRTPAK